jgi:hypothetical protein
LKNKKYSKEMVLGMYEKMLRIRKFETVLTEYFTKGMLYGNIHTSIGQEAIAVGACAALEKTDFMTALRKWDSQNKKVKCVYLQGVYDFDINSDWRKDFKVHAGMILDGEWYVEK